MARRRLAKEEFLVRRTNETVEALRQMENGNLNCQKFGGQFYGTANYWDHSSSRQQEVVEEIKELHERRTKARQSMSGLEAYQRMTRERPVLSVMDGGGSREPIMIASATSNYVCVAESHVLIHVCLFSELKFRHEF